MPCYCKPLQTQEEFVLTFRKTSRYARRLPWLSRELTTQLRFKKAAYGEWKNRQATKEEFRKVVQVYRGAVGKDPYRVVLKKMKPGSHNSVW